MDKVKELEQAVHDLSEEEYREFRKRFLSLDHDKWDQQIEEDSEAGKLDFLIEEAMEAKKNNKLKDL